MIKIAEARKKAEVFIKGTGLHLGSAMDDGEYFIFGYKEAADIAPIGVNKETGEAETYFPPDHMDAFLEAVRVKE